VSTSTAQAAVDQPIPESPQEVQWSPLRRVLFRFSFVFLGLSSMLPLALAARRTFQDTFLFPAIESF
jgi:hypothetical protein